MKKNLLFFIALISSFISLQAQSLKILTEAEVLAVAQKQFSGLDVDYYVLNDDMDWPEWTVFVDAHPTAGWAHEAYVLKIPRVTETTLELTLPSSQTMVMMPPKGNFVPLSVKNRYGDNANVKPYVPKAKSHGTSSPVEANHTYAVIINGGGNYMTNRPSMWNDCAFIYQTLVNGYGVPKNHIYPLMADGEDPDMDTTLDDQLTTISQSLDLDFDGEQDIFLSASLENVSNVMDSLAFKMSADDQLLFFFIGHGTRNIDKYNLNLWGVDMLESSDLRTYLEKITGKGATVNVVLGQCFSGGFLNDLNIPGCVVATSARNDEYAYKMSDLPYDKFVYYWTCAVNQADHQGMPVYSDSNQDGRVTMNEAFAYASSKYSSTEEHPQYQSNPPELGSVWALNHTVPEVDLYLKDNLSDTGYEPNNTTDIFWDSASIWVRNSQDGIYAHENPIYSATHTQAYIYVRVFNRGRTACTGGQYLKVYWANASTGLPAHVWRGLENSGNSNIATGGLACVVPISPIPACGAVDMVIPWNIPHDENVTTQGSSHFCLLAQISESAAEEPYDQWANNLNIRGSRKQAQKNVTVVRCSYDSDETEIIMRNTSDTPTYYNLELIPRYDASAYFINGAVIQLKLNDDLFQAWEQAGGQSDDVIAPIFHQTGMPVKVNFVSTQSKMKSIQLGAGAVHKLTVRFVLNKFATKHFTYKFDLVQTDSVGNIIGGETYDLVINPIIESVIGVDSNIDDFGNVNLSINPTMYTNAAWYDNNNDIIGNGNTLIVQPMFEPIQYSVIAENQDGELAVGSISLDNIFEMESAVYYADMNSVVVHFSNVVPKNATICITSAIDGTNISVKPLGAGIKEERIDIGNVPNGIYAVVYTVNGVVVDYKKVNVNN